MNTQHRPAEAFTPPPSAAFDIQGKPFTNSQDTPFPWRWLMGHHGECPCGQCEQARAFRRERPT